MAEREEGRYGRRLGADEYDRLLTRVHDRVLAEAGPSVSGAELDRRVREIEVDLAIDRRIGVDFPRDKRAELLALRERVEQRRRKITSRLLRRRISRERFAEEMQAAVRSMVAELSSDLTEAELSAFLGISEPDAAGLPLDVRLLDRDESGS